MKNTGIRIFLPFLLFGFSVSAQSNKNTEHAPPVRVDSIGWKVFSTADYSIKYPQDWELNSRGVLGASFFLMSPFEDEQDRFKENVNLIVQDLNGVEIDLDKYIQISEEQVRTAIANSSLLESKRVGNGNEGFHQLVFLGDQGNFHLRFEQYYWMYNKKAYVLTLTCEQKMIAPLNEVGQNILKSFVLKK
jgi:hypothetical protein